MFCKNCGTKSDDTKKFCTNCGNEFSSAGKTEPSQAESTPNFTKPKFESSWSAGRVIGIILVIAFIGWGIYASLDDDSISQNNDALSSFDSGNSDQAIAQFQQASQSAVTNETKINTLKNLGYVYATEGRYDEALSTFQEALKLASSGSVDYYLISGEIALLEYKPNATLLSFNKAYELSPTDFQVNNSLALFYLDLEEIAPQYTDYSKALFYAKRAYEYDIEKSEVSKQNLAIAHFFNENFDQTVSLLLTTNLNQHPYMAYWLGWAYAAKGDEINAKIYFQKALNAGIELEPEAYDYL